ncbi:hypothetical protein FQN53_002142 [Emmonsiellopsis sp. PD_33]|nr:hypothetical protein FQN53_002142 [Emmonsiellopsis sp. PD_33]
MADGGPPNLNLTPEEEWVFSQLFQAADKENLGFIPGRMAIPFFKKTNLPPDWLASMWQLADPQNEGQLSRSGFGVAMRLVGHAQAGREPIGELVLKPGPLPKFNGITVDTEPAAQPPPAASSRPPGTRDDEVPQLRSEDAAKFAALFDQSDVHNGVLSGEKAKQIFERARLRIDILGGIWGLADTKQRGALDATEFIIAMHLLSAFRTGTMKRLPQTLPPGLYDAAARRGAVRTSTSSRPPPDVPPVPAIPKQYSGSGPQRAQSPLNRPPQFQSTVSVQSTGSDWTITPQEKAHFDTVFATVDKGKLGYITGDQAVEFLTNSQLPEETLASIWDLADIDRDGQLSKEEFAVAMYLVRQQHTTREPLPHALPLALIPPSMRQQAAPPPRRAPQNTAQRPASQDIFGADFFAAPAQPAPPPQVAPQIPQSTGGSNPPFQTPSSPTRPLAGSATFKPFVPSSTFGQSLTPHTTGLGAPAQPKSPPAIGHDLLSDLDSFDEHKGVSQETSNLADLSNQIGSLSRDMQNVQGKRGAAEQELSQNAKQRQDFVARLAQARTMYEQEAKDFKALEERLATSRAETRKVEQEFAMVDATRQDLQNQYNQISAALDSDKRENANLKEKIRQANAQVSQLKPQLEKARSEARQQKGLVAINKKQLATVEGERDRLQGEIDEATKEIGELQRQASSQSAPTQPAAAAVTSPAPSTSSQTNPFFRRTASSSDNAFPLPPTSPQESTKGAQQSMFDDVFGAAFSVPSTSTPPPPTSFRTESPSQPGPASPPIVKTSDTTGSPTPSASPMSAEPPPPPQSRQISSSQLPIAGHQQSEASSVKPSPPASRFGTSVVSEDAPKEGGEAKSPFDTEAKAASSPIPGAFPTDTAQPVASPSESAKKDVSFDELFRGVGHARSQSQKANDFEEAFAAMKVKNGSSDSGFPQSNGASAKVESKEFPPIRELDDDDDSTDSEQPRGFDDDFSPVSPPRQTDSAPRDITAPEPFSFPSPGTAEKDTSETAPDFNGVTSAPKEASETSKSPEPAKPPATGSDAKKSGAPDFEAAFAGIDLAPAKEADDDDSDDDDFESHYNKDPSSFDMSFESPNAPSKSSTIANAMGTGSGNNTTNADFFSFDSQQQPSSSSPFAQQKSGPPASGNANAPHDWDALFSVASAPKNDDGSPKDTSASPEATTQEPSTLSFPQPPGGKDSKPPGWALAADSGEDDLILQRLTGMGYPRDESLAALEKFDYNIDKAADFLASKS